MSYSAMTLAGNRAATAALNRAAGFASPLPPCEKPAGKREDARRERRRQIRKKRAAKRAAHPTYGPSGELRTGRHPGSKKQ